MNRFFLAFASIFTSGIFAFSYLNEWLSVKFWDQPLLLKPSGDIVYPYFHQSPALYLRVMLIFGMLFFLLCLASVAFSFQKNQKNIFLCFVLTMLGILAAMVNGAIK